MSKKNLIKEDGPALSKEEIRKIIQSISTLENEKDDISSEIKALKGQLEDGGFTKKQINEAIRLMKMEDSDRNEMLKGSNTILVSAGRCEIVL